MKIGKLYKNDSSYFVSIADCTDSNYMMRNYIGDLCPSDIFILLDFSVKEEVVWLKVLTQSGMIGWVGKDWFGKTLTKL